MTNSEKYTNEDRLTALVLASAKASQTVNTVAILEALSSNLKEQFGQSPDASTKVHLKAVESACKKVTLSLQLHLECAWDTYYLSLPFRQKHKARLDKEQWIRNFRENLETAAGLAVATTLTPVLFPDPIVANLTRIT